MQTPQRQRELSVIALLAEQPYQFQFAQAVRLLVRLLRKNGVHYERGFRHGMRLKNSMSLCFPVSEIEALLADGDCNGNGNDNDRGAAERLKAAITQGTPAHIILTPA